MEIRELQPGNFADIFQTADKANQPASTGRFGMEYNNADLFSTTDTTTIASTTDTTTLASTTDTTTVASTTDTTTVDPNNTDILGGDKPQPGRPKKYDFSDASGYFEDRIKSGKFVAINQEDETGNVTSFIPKTPEEFDEVIDIQVNYQLDQKKKELETSWYQSKSPAWQAVAKYAEMADDPSEILPFIQGVRTIQSVAAIDENEIDGAEKIVRARLEQRGEPDELIDEQIESLKTTDKLISTAKAYKPIILNQEKQQLANMANEQKRKEAEWNAVVNDVRENAIKAIESPIFGKQKLKRDEMAAVYQLIAEPSAELNGYPIYAVIDNLFDKKDFDTLRQVALLLTKKDAYLGYISNNAAEQTAAKLQTKLRVANDSRTNSSTSNDDTDRPTVNRNQYKAGTTRFGR